MLAENLKNKLFEYLGFCSPNIDYDEYVAAAKERYKLRPPVEHPFSNERMLIDMPFNAGAAAGGADRYAPMIGVYRYLVSMGSGTTANDIKITPTTDEAWFLSDFKSIVWAAFNHLLALCRYEPLVCQKITKYYNAAYVFLYLVDILGLTYEFFRFADKPKGGAALVVDAETKTLILALLDYFGLAGIAPQFGNIHKIAYQLNLFRIEYLLAPNWRILI